MPFNSASDAPELHPDNECFVWTLDPQKRVFHVTDPTIARALMYDASATFPDRGMSAVARYFREDAAGFVNTKGGRWMRCVLFHTGPHTTPHALCSPILKDFSRRFSPPTPRCFQSRRTSTPFNSASDAFQLHPDIALYGPSTLSYRKMGTASVNGGALDRLAGKVTDTSEALVRNWNARIDDTYGRENPENGGVEVDVADASQAVTLEVIHEALFRRVLFCLAPVPVRPRSRRERKNSLRT